MKSKSLLIVLISLIAASYLSYAGGNFIVERQRYAEAHSDLIVFQGRLKDFGRENGYYPTTREGLAASGLDGGDPVLDPKLVFPRPMRWLETLGATGTSTGATGTNTSSDRNQAIVHRR
jgi:hypothetical protein